MHDVESDAVRPFGPVELITGGSPSFRRLKGLLITNLPPGYRAELNGTIPRDEGLRMSCLN